ncbi:MAG: TIGR02147 family protein [Bacteriovoracia bacterium]
MEGTPTVFDFDDYKDFLKATFSGKGTWGLISKLAEAAGCQRSYLSRVIHEEVHLTPDHGYGLGKGLRLNADEFEYFLALLEKARAASKSYREHLEAKIRRLKREHEDLSKRVQRPAQTVLSPQLQSYYSSWHWSAIHIAVSVPTLQTVPAISRRLSLPEAAVESALRQLHSMGLVKNDGGRWSYLPTELHTPKNSPYVNMHHANWRQRATLDAQDPTRDSLHYTVVQSMDRNAYEKIRREFLATIEQASNIARPAPEEKLVCITCDIFEP